MDAGVRKNVFEWRFNLMETLGFAGTAVSIAIWTMMIFQTKADANMVKDDLSSRITKMESEVGTIRAQVGGVAVDVSYIRGLLEPKSHK